jgi:predicted Rossmann fold flavoprotein
MPQTERPDVVVIGGGPAGLLAAVSSQMAGARTLLAEKGDKLGRKLGISGGGRCNVTNAKALPELMENIPGNGRFLYSVLNRFSNADIAVFFESLGIRLKEEDRGRVFPVSDKASTVVQALVGKVCALGVNVRTHAPVRRLLADGGRVTGVELQSGERIACPAIVVATGGCSVPHTGSTGDAYPWARALGHQIVDPYPTEVPLTSDEPFIRARELQGLSLRSVDVAIVDARGKRLTTQNGDLIFTHFGLSGPVALRCSHYVSTSLRRQPGLSLTAQIDCLPGVTSVELAAELAEARRRDQRKHLKNTLLTWLPERLAQAVLAQAGTEGETQTANLSHEAVLRVTAAVKEFAVGITGTLPLEKATVTGGGVSIREIDPRTMGSKLCAGLYFAGEVMDVHAHTGGYNITVAFSTGYCAGAHAARYALGAAAS